MVMDRNDKDKIEYSSAVICIMAAISIGLASIVVSETHDIAAGVLIFIAQLLLFSASVFHLNYKLNQYGESKSKGTEE